MATGTAAADDKEPVLADKPLGYWTERLKENDLPTRLEAARVLSKCGPDAKAAVAPLIDALYDGDRRVRSAAAAGLAGIGPAAKTAVNPLLAVLLDPDEGVREQACAALGRLAEPKSTVDPLGDMLKDKSAGVRRTAAESLARYRTDAAPAAARLVDAARGAGRNDFYFINLVGGKAEPELAFFDETHQPVADALAGIGTAAVDPLVAALKDSDEPLRLLAAVALARIGGDAANPAVAPLTEMLKHGSEFTRVAAAEALGHIGPAAKDATAALKESGRDEGGFEERVLRVVALGALARVNPSETEGAVKQLAGRLDTLMALAAGATLAKIGPAAKPAVPIMLARSEKAGPRQRRLFAGWIKAIDAEAAGAVDP
jgi:HEAT repeat protein